ncbi:hypothetical protein HDU86_001595 [Geranomyces michiganensis]|nr:hypothetical protein HDU86_001595 [Geranomyces michiganensis]
MSDEEEALPSDLPSCIDLLASLNVSIAQTDQDLWDATLSYGEKTDTINWILCLVLEIILIILLLDRITALQHKLTRNIFILAVTTSILFDLLMAVGTSTAFTTTTTTHPGTTYAWARVPLAAVGQWAVVYLLYLRISDTLLLGATAARICMLFMTALVFPLEIAAQAYGAVHWEEVQRVDVDLNWLAWLVAGYKLLLDTGFNYYAFRVIYSNGVCRAPSSETADSAGAHSSSSSSSSKSARKDTGFILGFLARTILFLASDILHMVLITVTTTTTAANSSNNKIDTSFPTQTLWACSLLLGIIKPYLICTDVARIRGLSSSSSSSQAAAPFSAGTTKVQTASGKAGGDVSKPSLTRLKSAEMVTDEEEPP